MPVDVRLLSLSCFVAGALPLSGSGADPGAIGWAVLAIVAVALVTALPLSFEAAVPILGLAVGLAVVALTRADAFGIGTGCLLAAGLLTMGAGPRTVAVAVGGGWLAAGAHAPQAVELQLVAVALFAVAGITRLVRVARRGSAGSTAAIFGITAVAMALVSLQGVGGAATGGWVALGALAWSRVEHTVGVVETAIGERVAAARIPAAVVPPAPLSRAA